MKKAILLCLAVLVSSFAITAQNSKYSFSEIFDVSSSSDLTIIMTDGDVTVEAHDVNKIEFLYSIIKRGTLITGTKAEIMDLIASQIDIQAKQTRNKILLKVHSKKTSGIVDYLQSYSINIKVLVPKETECSVILSDGDISICGLGPDQSCITEDGDISGKDLGKDFGALTSNGDISAINIQGDVSARTSDGNISAINITGDVSARTSDGDIKTKNISGELNGHTIDGKVTRE